MSFLRMAQFSQVKTSSLVQSNVSFLFKRFRLIQILRQSYISKEKGHPVEYMLNLMLIIVLQGSRSLYSGMASLQASRLKSPLNSMLNNEFYNWRNLLYRISSRFAKLCSTPEGKISALIIDDTAKEKTGRRVENSSWFVDHCRKAYYMGYQTIMAAWHNGVVTIPLDFELKIGKSRIKHANKSHYHKGTHTEQRQRMAKQKKTKIAESFIRRAIQRGFRFRYLLWDSWYNNSSSLSFVFGTLRNKGIDLVAMVKRDGQRYLWGDKFVTVKELYRKAGKWQHNQSTGIMYKSVLVGVLDKHSATQPELQTVLGYVRMCFFRYPQHKRYKALICTEVSLGEMDILSIYLRRWSIEVVFKDLKQYFGYDQSKSSKYAPQIADLTIRCMFYVMFCSLKYDYPSKSTQQLLIEFYSEMEDNWLDIFCSLVFINNAKRLLEYALSLGYSGLAQLLNDYDLVLKRFMNWQWYDNEIEEVDKSIIALKGYRYAS